MPITEDMLREVPTTEKVLPLGEQQEVISTPSPYEDNGVLPTENQKKDQVLRQATSDFSKGKDPRDSFSGVLALSPEEYDAQSVQEAQLRMKDRAVSTIDQAMELGPEALEAVVQNEQQELNTMGSMSEASTKLAPYVAFVDSLPNSEKLTLREKSLVAADLMASGAMGEVWDKLSKWDVAVDFIGMMVAPDDNLTTTEVHDRLRSYDDAVEDFEHDTFWIELALHRRTLSDDEVLALDNAVLEILEDVDDNDVTKIMNVMRTAGQDFASAEELKLEQIELLTLGAGTGARILRNLSKLSQFAATGKVGATRAAKFIAEGAFKSNSNGAEVGTSPIDAGVSGSSLNATEGSPIVSNGTLPTDMSPKLKAVMDDVDEHLKTANEVVDLDDYILSEVDVDLMVEKVAGRFNKKENVENLIVEKDGKNFTIKYDTRNENGDLISNQESFSYSKDDIGEGLFDTNPGFFPHALKAVASPNTLLGKDRKNFVELVEVALHQQSKANVKLAEAYNAALKPVRGNKKSMQNLNNMLHKLNGVDQEFGYKDLVVDGYGGQRLTPNEFVAWKGVRRVMDEAHSINNRILREEMQLRGVKSVQLQDGTSAYVRSYDDAGSAMRGYEADKHSNVMVEDPDGDLPKTFAKVDKATVDEMYAKGYKLVKSDSKEVDHTFKKGPKRFKFAFVKNDKVTNLDEQVLNKVQNYVPRTYKDANFFIRVMDEVEVDGQSKKIPRTVAFATTRDQALKYMTKVNKTRVEQGLDELDFSEPVFEGQTRMGSDEDIVRMQGGLVRGSRSQNKLEYAGHRDTESMTNDPLDVIQDALNFTAKRMPMSRFRIGLQERLYNELDQIDPGLRGISWEELRGAITNLGDRVTGSYRTKLTAAYDQIDALSGVPTRAEQNFQGLIRSVAQSLDGKLKDDVVKWLYRTSETNPVQAIKSATYNLTLGTFSVVQLPIQAASAANAFAVAPRRFAQAAPKAILTSTIDLIKNRKAALKEASKKSSTPDGFTKDYDLWTRSGYRESVVQTGGDFGSISRGQPYDAGTLRRLVGTINDKGQMFFKSGELWNRRFSFFTALEEIKAQKGKNFKYSDQDLVDVMSRAEKIMLGMSTGNKAAFQKGFWGLPLQFKQIFTKSIEAYTGDWFTKAEKSRIAATQVALYGAAGIPILNSMGNYVISLIPGSEQWTEEQLTLAKRGVAGWLLNDHLDIDAAFSGRMTTSADLLDEINRSLFDEVPLYEVLLGASNSTVSRVWDTARQSLTTTADLLSAEDLSFEQISQAAKVIGLSLAELPAGSRNAVAAYDLYHNKVFRKKDGTPLWHTDPDMLDVMARAVGYQSQEKEDLYELAMSERAYNESIKAKSEQYMLLLHRLAMSNDGDELYGAYQEVIRNIKEEFKGTPDGDKIIKSLTNKIKSADGKREKEIRNALERANSDLVDAANETSVLLRGETNE